MLRMPLAKFLCIFNDIARNGDVSVTVLAQVVDEGRRHHT